jgi:spore maturation protein CgeB
VSEPRLRCIFLGLTITSTWGNGHATTYRGLLKELARRGHSVTFLERDVPWYAGNREFTEAPYCKIGLYENLPELKDRYAGAIREADVVVVGSYVPDGIAVGKWVNSTARHCTAFYDIDTPVTLANLAAGKCEYLSYDLIPAYQVYFSFTGGPLLDHIEQQLGSPCARPLYCSVDPSLYFPEARQSRWDLAYLGTYAQDRQPALERLLLSVASALPKRRFAVAGPQYPADTAWPSNVERIEHLPATQHRSFYNSQRFTLNLTRQDMIAAGYSPSVRLFESAACGTPILTDKWAGLSNFFEPYTEIVPVSTPEDVTSYLRMPDEQRLEIADNARRRTLRFHTAAVRAEEFESQAVRSLELETYAKKRSRVSLRRAPTAALI